MIWSRVLNLAFYTSVSFMIMVPAECLFSSGRPFVFGSLNESGSTVGMNELLRVFPERRAQFYFLTWNMMGLSISVRHATLRLRVRVSERSVDDRPTCRSAPVARTRTVLYCTALHVCRSCPRTSSTTCYSRANSTSATPPPPTSTCSRSRRRPATSASCSRARRPRSAPFTCCSTTASSARSSSPCSSSASSSGILLVCTCICILL